MKRLLSGLLTLSFACYLGVHGRYLALYEDNHLTQVFPYILDSYSPAERDALIKGIPYRSATELHRLLEDYMS